MSEKQITPFINQNNSVNATQQSSVNNSNNI